MENEEVIKNLINYFTKNNKIDFSYENISEILLNTNIDNNPIIEDIFDDKNWLEKLFEIENISFRIIGDDFGTYSDLPNNLEFLKNLKSIDFAENVFNEIPIEILKFEKLENISFSNNNLKTFPKILAKHNNLKTVGLLGNPFIDYNFSYKYSNKITFEDFKNKFEKFNKQNSEFSATNWYINFNRKEIDIYIYQDLESENMISVIIEKKNQNYEINEYEIYNEFKTFFEKKCKLNYIDSYLFIGNEKVKNDIIKFVPNEKNFYWVSLNELIKKKEENEKVLKINNLDPFFISDLIKKIGGIDLLFDINNKIEKEIKENKPTINYLNNIKIKNFKIYEQIEITEITDKINVIIGLNGTGKTTLLQAITMGFLPKNYDVNFSVNNFLNRKVEKNKKLPEDEKYIGIIFNESYDKRFFGNNEFPEILNDINRDCIFLTYGVNLFNKENLDHKLYAEKIIEGEDSAVSIDSIFIDYTDEFYDPLRILDAMLDFEERKNVDNKQINDSKLIREIIKQKLDIFLDLDEIEKCQIEKINGKYKFTNQKGEWNLQELSEGYRANILLISDILMRILASRKTINNENIEIIEIFEQTKGFILIDEFDRHLHPVWQRSFLTKLKEILPKIQFFVTTHNVFALQSAAGENLIQLTNDAKAIYKTEKILNSSILALTTKYFTNSLFDYKTQKDLELFSKILNQIYSTEIDINYIYNPEFKDLVHKLNNLGGEIQTIIASELLQLNSTLKQLKKEEFVL